MSPPRQRLILALKLVALNLASLKHHSTNILWWLLTRPVCRLFSCRLSNHKSSLVLLVRSVSSLIGHLLPYNLLHFIAGILLAFFSPPLRALRHALRLQSQTRHKSSMPITSGAKWQNWLYCAQVDPPAKGLLASFVPCTCDPLRAILLYLKYLSLSGFSYHRTNEQLLRSGHGERS